MSGGLPRWGLRRYPRGPDRVLVAGGGGGREGHPSFSRVVAVSLAAPEGRRRGPDGVPEPGGEGQSGWRDGGVGDAVDAVGPSGSIYGWIPFARGPLAYALSAFQGHRLVAAGIIPHPAPAPAPAPRRFYFELIFNHFLILTASHVNENVRMSTLQSPSAGAVALSVYVSAV